MSRPDWNHDPMTRPSFLPLHWAVVLLAMLAIATSSSLAVCAAPAGDPPDAAQEAPDPELVDRGKNVYRTQCQSCHGPDGKGDGPASRFLDSPPADLTDESWKVAKDGSLEEIVRVIREGVEGTGMEPMGEILDEDEIRAVAVYVREVVTSPGDEEDEEPEEGGTEGRGRTAGDPTNVGTRSR